MHELRWKNEGKSMTDEQHDDQKDKTPDTQSEADREVPAAVKT